MRYGLILLCSFSLWAASHHPQAFLQSIKGDPKASEKIYQQFCSNCHARHPLISVGAPRVGDKKAWDRRLKDGYAQLLSHSLEGIGLMPARGGCFECSDEEIKMVIDYMIKQ